MSSDKTDKPGTFRTGDTVTGTVVSTGITSITGSTSVDIPIDVSDFGNSSRIDPFDSPTTLGAIGLKYPERFEVTMYGGAPAPWDAPDPFPLVPQVPSIGTDRIPNEWLSPFYACQECKRLVKNGEDCPFCLRKLADERHAALVAKLEELQNHVFAVDTNLNKLLDMLRIAGPTKLRSIHQILEEQDAKANQVISTEPVKKNAKKKAKSTPKKKARSRR